MKAVRLGSAAIVAVAMFGFTAGQALAAINPVTNDTAGADQLADAISAPPTNVTGASFAANPGAGTPHGVIDAPLSSFPTAGATAGLITSGDAQLADDPNTEVASVDLAGAPVRGDTDTDVSVLKIDLDVPVGANCLTFDFQFYSEEYPEYVGTGFNDAFIAELDSSTWTTSGSSISAPDNFAFDPSGDVISINSSGNTSMSAENAAGTTYDGATPLLKASKVISPGSHSLYLSIFDQGDMILDSATLIDGLTVAFVPDPEVNCKPGAQPKQFSLDLDPASAENAVGTDHTVTATLTDENGDPVAAADVDFTVTGANSASGTETTNASGEASFTYTGANAGNDTIAACYDADDEGTCEAVASATKTWTGVVANLPPTADAGADQTVDSGAAVNLNGSGSSDPDGDPLTYSWTQTGGPAVSLSGANTATPSFTAPTGPATLSFQLEVCDDGTPSLCDTDTVAVEVNPPVVEGNDYAARVIVKNPTWATNGKTKTRGFVVKVSNLGAGPFAVTPGDIDAEVLVNGVATGSVAFVKSTEVVPGKRVKFHYKWTYSGVAAGDDVEYSGCVNAAGDPNDANDCGSHATTAVAKPAVKKRRARGRR